ncbi:NAD(P)-binding protein [Serendipita vermifera]|nr:NAD(P)-binding protein [Serendipita vermifera]
MSNKPIIAVFAATGKTGGGMIKAILEDGTFSARAVARNPESEAAKALASQGVEVFKADLNDPASLEAALQGTYGVLGVTDWWSSFHGEEQQGKDLVDAAKKTGVEHFVWTTLEHSDIPHWNTKARINDHLIASGVPRTSLYSAFFAENVGNPKFWPVKPNDSGEIVQNFPLKTDGPMPMIAASDIGAWALVAFKNPEQWIGKDMKVCTEWKTAREIYKILEEELGAKVVYNEVDEEQWKAVRYSGLPFIEETWLNMQWFYDHYPDGNGRDIAYATSLIPHATTLREYIRAKGKSLTAA